MKEQYYTNDTIDQQARTFLEEITPLRNRYEIKINHAKVALLIIDMQNYFVDQASHAYIPSVAAIIPRVLKLQNYCLQNGIRVIQTRHVNTKENAGMMAKWWGGRLLESIDTASEIIAAIANPKTVAVVKSQYDAFYNSTLESVLKIDGIEQLVIIGLMTHLCCETTARLAFTRGYEVFFSIDGTATYNRRFHLATLVNLAHGFATPMLIDEIIRQLKMQS
jgi:bifunctional isochorismate lyase/aryl carrier protein